MIVRWTPNANKSYEYIMTCATDFYGHKVLRQLVSSIKEAERLLADNPLLGSLELLIKDRAFEYRSIVLSKPFKLIYAIYEQTIYIADIWDTRQSPDKLADRIK